MANEMDKIVVKVVGPTSDDFASRSNVGDKLVIRLNTYPKDPTAIKLESMTGEEAGFVAAKNHTAMGHPLASEVYNDVKEGDIVEISNINPFLVSITKATRTTSITKTKARYYAILCGSKIEYPNRVKVVAEMRKRQDEEIELDMQLVGDKIVISFEGLPCGYVNSEVKPNAEPVLKARNIEITPIEKIKSVIDSGNRVDVKTQFLNGMVIPIIFEFESESNIQNIGIGSKDYDTILKSFDDSDASEIQKRVDWLKSIKTAEYAISLFMNKIKNHKGISPFAPCYIPQKDEIENAIAFTHGIGDHRGNLLLTGPAGSGKNMFVITFANLMNLQLIDKSCSAGVDEEAIFGYLSMKASEEKPDSQAVNLAFKKILTSVGFSKIEDKKSFAELDVESQIKTLKEILDDDFDYSVLFDAMKNQTAEIKFEPSIITKSMEYPSLINFDEVNTLRPIVTASLHAALDKRRSVLVNGYKTVKIDNDVILTATMNEGSDYSGTSTMNLAFEDRWHILEFQAPESISEILKQEIPTLNSKTITTLNKIYQQMKKMKSDGEIQERSFSQRAFIYCGINIALGNDIKKAIMATIIAKIRDAEDQSAVLSIIDMMLK